MAERRLPVEEQYPNNSHTAKERAAEAQDSKPREKKELAKVTKGKVTQRKKPLGKRIARAFGVGEDQGILEYIFQDIIIPATKDMIVDSITNGAEMAILGEQRGRRRRPSDRRGTTRYSYDRVSFRDDRRYPERDPEDRRRYANLNDYNDIVFDSANDAEEVLSGMIELIDAYGQATILDLYDLSGLTPPDYTVGNYGWQNLSSAKPRRNRDGYILDLPRATLLRR